MNINRISYTTLRNTQSFGDVFANSNIMKACNITHCDIQNINKRKCNKNLNVYVYYYKKDPKNKTDIVRIKGIYNNKNLTFYKEFNIGHSKSQETKNNNRLNFIKTLKEYINLCDKEIKNQS